MDILDMFIQIGPGFCFVVTMFTGETPNVVMNIIHMSLELWMVSSSEVTLATGKILYLVMGVLYVSIQIESAFCFIVTVSTGERPNVVMNSIHMSLKTMGHLETTLLASVFVIVKVLFMLLKLQLNDSLVVTSFTSKLLQLLEGHFNWFSERHFIPKCGFCDIYN